MTRSQNKKYNLSLSELMDFFCETKHQGFSLEEVEEAEKRLGISFPQTYRNFLLTYGKDKVTTHGSRLIAPREIYSSRELLAEDTTEDEYIIIWYEKEQWYAGYQKRDLLDGVPDPFIYLCTDDDRRSCMVCADGTEEFLLWMLRDAAKGWNGGKYFVKSAQIEQVLSGAGIDLRRMQISEIMGCSFGTCLAGGRLYFYYEKKLYIANHTLSEQETDIIEELDKEDSNCKPVSSTMEIFFGGNEEWLYYEPRRTVVSYDGGWGVNSPKPQSGIPIHPWIAWMIERNFHHKPSTAYDWDKDIRRIKTLLLEPRFGTIRSEDAESIDVQSPMGYRLAPPYYYDLHDWSVIGRMTKLQSLVIKGVYIDDFSFLKNCKYLRVLGLYNTNFSDCRLLMELPNLKETNLIFCPLEHTEILQNLSGKYCIEATFGLCPELKVESVPDYGREISGSKDIEKLLEADYCRFITKNDSLEVRFSSGRAAFFKYTTYSNDVFFYDNGSGNCEPVELIAGYCPEERMMCYDSRAIRNIVFYFCGGSGRVRYNKWIPSC